MGKNKLKKIAEMEYFPHVFQYPYIFLKKKGFEMKGEWNKKFFKNDLPIVLELGCGKGEYTLELAKIFPNKNFVGIDIKGSRMYSGAKKSWDEGLSNTAFLRTHIELINHFFSPNEISEIWLTFPDPQIKKNSKRLTSVNFISCYSRILAQDGIIHLKTDSHFLFHYTLEMLKKNCLPILFQTEDLYEDCPMNKILSVQTFYEQQWLKKGLKIKYLRFGCLKKEKYIEPMIEIEPDIYRSSRGLKFY